MRSADAHLTPRELELLLFEAADSNTRGMRAAVEPEAQHHLNECSTCQSLAERYRRAETALSHLEAMACIHPEGFPEAGPDCPSEEVWLSIAVGLINDDVAANYLAHAATCEGCGLYLKHALEDMAPDVTSEEREELERSPLASMDWQREMGRRLATWSQNQAPIVSLEIPISRTEPASRPDPARTTTQRKTRFFWWPRLVWSTGLVLAATLIWFIWFATSATYTNRLLTQSYTAQRTIELRLPKASYGPLRIERGNGQEMPPEFRKAAAILQRNAASHGEDPRWLQLQARADLLEWNFQDALDKLDRALLLRTKDRELLLDKAMALYEKAKEGQDPLHHYSQAIGILDQILVGTPDDPVALFNRSVIEEELSLFMPAFRDCEHYLQVDSDSSWAQEMKARYQRLKKAQTQGLPPKGN